MEPMSWEYVAGFFDGEGCISLQTNTSHKQRDYHRVRLIFSQSARQDKVLDEIAEFLEAEGFHPTMTSTLGGSMTQLILYRKSEIGGVLDGMLPYLRVKHQQAVEAFDFMQAHNIH